MKPAKNKKPSHAADTETCQMDPNKLVFELSHPDRVAILDTLEKEPMRISQIAEALKLNTAEASRHLGRLSDSKIIQKGNDSLFH